MAQRRMEENTMIKNSNLYDILKWISIIGLPALVVAIPSLFEVWGIPYGEQIAKTLQIIAVLLGTWIGVSNVNYYQNKATEGEDPYKLG